ncbi:imidazole glycerol phosphate synthase subunit HisH [Sphingomonas gei]|uniref:Imidazole glycerol phosphate synthase subunit HisH n=1 Tax=Sphingomonas gei TaxID=1395960 RepID=A0A4S1X355_9SPHN|nr:imidazole glycerol phosphate synthase subunit HisH [Sphingomonas gei]TGX50378.1 imidazole glycerol phosphate synthase subunit HisH [Sphingomonas gei]
MTSKVTILDYGMCNLLNVARAFQVLGADVLVTDDAATAAAAERLVVPGVGAFKDSVDEVQGRGFDQVIRDYVATGRPFLGICVGMQMLFDASEEFGEHRGLGLLPGRVRGVPALTTEGAPQRVPHIGWNHLVVPEARRSWEGTFLDNCVDESPSVYFVHSFAAVPELESDRLADCIYGGHRLCAAVQRDNLMAVQFHPERSARQGLGMLQGFMQL